MRCASGDSYRHNTRTKSMFCVHSKLIKIECLLISYAYAYALPNIHLNNNLMHLKTLRFFSLVLSLTLALLMAGWLVESFNAHSSTKFSNLFFARTALSLSNLTRNKKLKYQPEFGKVIMRTPYTVHIMYAQCTHTHTIHNILHVLSFIMIKFKPHRTVCK